MLRLVVSCALLSRISAAELPIAHAADASSLQHPARYYYDYYCNCSFSVLLLVSPVLTLLQVVVAATLIVVVAGAAAAAAAAAAAVAAVAAAAAAVAQTDLKVHGAAWRTSKRVLEKSA